VIGLGRARRATFAVLGTSAALMLGACSGSPPHTVAELVASLPKTSAEKPAGPFTVGHLPSGHVIDAVVRGTSGVSAPGPWCVKTICASAAFSAWRNLAGSLGSGARDGWPAGSYVVTFGAPAPRVDDHRKNLLPTGTAIDVAMLPGSRADLALGANYNVMGTDDGEHGSAQDVWFEQRLVNVGGKRDVLTESYGSDENFPRDTKTLYFEGPHGELGVARATTDIFFGAGIWSRIVSAKARVRAARREAARQQIGDAELIAVAASVHAATDAEFDAAATRVADNRVCTLDLQHQSTRDEHLIASGTLTSGQRWNLRQGHDAAGHATCPRDASTCPHVVGPCFEWTPSWGDWQRSGPHAVYSAFVSQSNGLRTLLAVAPAVRTVRITRLTNDGKETPALTFPTAPGVNGVRWAFAPVPAHRVTALDANGKPLETVRTDLAGP
jgi:hypothetical protein